MGMHIRHTATNMNVLRSIVQSRVIRSTPQTRRDAASPACDRTDQAPGLITPHKEYRIHFAVGRWGFRQKNDESGFGPTLLAQEFGLAKLRQEWKQTHAKLQSQHDRFPS